MNKRDLKKRGCSLFVCAVIAVFYLVPVISAYAAGVAADAPQKGLSLLQLIASGGIILAVLGVMSIITVAIVVYCGLFFRPEKLVPNDFAEDLVNELSKKQIASAKRMCELSNNLVAKVALAGIQNMGKDNQVISEFMEHKSREEATGLWRLLNYLSDIANIAPLLGLLGTVIGMIQAFSVIAVEGSVVKPVMLAVGVSKAMVATAGGLVVALIAMAAFSVFRTKLQGILQRAEYHIKDVMILILAANKKG